MDSSASQKFFKDYEIEHILRFGSCGALIKFINSKDKETNEHPKFIFNCISGSTMKTL